MSEKPTYYYVNVNHGVIIPSHDYGPILTFRGMGLIFGVVSYPSITHNVLIKSSPSITHVYMNSKIFLSFSKVYHLFPVGVWNPLMNLVLLNCKYLY